MSGHTPGPWTAEAESRRDHPEAWSVYAQDQSEYAAVGELAVIACDLTEANARLLAAAPDLLAAVLELIGDLEHREPDGWMSGNVHQRAYDLALNAIAKAKGEFEAWSARKAEAPMTREEPYRVGSGNRSTDYIITGPGLRENIHVDSWGGQDMEALAQWITRWMNTAYASALSIAAAARKSAEDERDAFQRSLAEQGAILDWVMDAVSGQEPVSDFAESFPAVRQAKEWRRQAWQQGNEHAALIYAERDKEWERKVKSAKHSRQALAEALRDLINEEGDEPMVEHEHFNAPGIRCPRCLIVKALATHGQDR